MWVNRLDIFLSCEIFLFESLPIVEEILLEFAQFGLHGGIAVVIEKEGVRAV